MKEIIVNKEKKCCFYIGNTVHRLSLKSALKIRTLDLKLGHPVTRLIFRKDWILPELPLANNVPGAY